MAPQLTRLCRSRSQTSSRVEALPGPATSNERVIEIRLPNGIVIRVSNAVEVEPLRRVLTAVVGR